MNNLTNIQKTLLVMAISLLALTAINGAYDGYYRFQGCMNGYLFYSLRAAQYISTAFFVFSLLMLVYLLVKRMMNNNTGSNI